MKKSIQTISNKTIKLLLGHLKVSTFQNGNKTQKKRKAVLQSIYRLKLSFTKLKMYNFFLLILLLKKIPRTHFNFVADIIGFKKISIENLLKQLTLLLAVPCIQSSLIIPMGMLNELLISFPTYNNIYKIFKSIYI